VSSGNLAAFERASRVIPGGVNSPVRAFKGVGGTPFFVAEARGCTLVDIEGNAYVDYVMSWGPLILGHAHPGVVAAVAAAAERGTSYGAPTEAETELAELVCAAMPWIEKLRFCSSGTEATMSALRLARAFTERAKVIKFAGCYHGHGDAFLVAAGSGALTLGVPDSPGVTEGVAADTLALPFNDPGAVRDAFRAHPHAIAAVIVEPCVGNMGLVPAQPGYLAALRELTREHGALLIFDEVMTGFRVGPGGVAGAENVSPDLTTLGKVIGGGLPVGAFGGRAEIMDLLAPLGPVYQAGTLSGNPLAMAAGIATLRGLQAPGTYEQLERATARLCAGLAEVAAKHRVPLQIARRGSMFGFFFTETPVVDLTTAKTSDTAAYARFFHAMLERGIYFAPSQFEAGFVSTAHDDAALDATLAAANAALS
jgi:glutamate-1-semialdehyde 2,1-aminomutase